MFKHSHSIVNLSIETFVIDIYEYNIILSKFKTTVKGLNNFIKLPIHQVRRDTMQDVVP